MPTRTSFMKRTLNHNNALTHKESLFYHNSHTFQYVSTVNKLKMAEMTREPELHSLYPDLQPLSAAQIQENNDFLATMQRGNQPKITPKINHPGAGLLAQVAMVPQTSTVKPSPPPAAMKPTVTQTPIPAERSVKPETVKPEEQELDLDGNPYPTEETGDVCTSPVEQDTVRSKTG